MTDALLTNGTFFFPGPTEVRPAVLEAMTRPMIPHRGMQFESGSKKPLTYHPRWGGY